MNRNIAIILMFGAIYLVISSSFSDKSSQNISIVQSDNNEPQINNGVQSWAFNNMTLHINNNWSLTSAAYAWCSGSGVWGDPYLIENVTVNGMQVRPCIVIENTRDYFLIRNCTLFNATTANKAGISFNNVTNGSIVDNRIYSNYFGVRGNASSNITISGNSIRANSKDGIYFTDCNINKLKDNLVQDNEGNGIYLSSSDQNDITNLNIIHRNKLYGVYLTVGSDHNNVSENYIGYNIEGCVRDDGEDNTFERNDCVGEYEEETNYGALEEQELDPTIIFIVIVAIVVVAGLVIVQLVFKKNRKNKLIARAPRNKL